MYPLADDDDDDDDDGDDDDDDKLSLNLLGWTFFTSVGGCHCSGKCTAPIVMVGNPPPGNHNLFVSYHLLPTIERCPVYWPSSFKRSKCLRWHELCLGISINRRGRMIIKMGQEWQFMR